MVARTIRPPCVRKGHQAGPPPLLVAAAMVLIPFIMVVSMAQAKGVRR
jgi:hypothetical protein